MYIETKVPLKTFPLKIITWLDETRIPLGGQYCELQELFLLELSKETRLHRIPKVVLSEPEFSFLRESFGLVHIPAGVQGMIELHLC